MHAPGVIPTAWLTVGRGLHFLAAPLQDGDVYWSPLVKIPVLEVETISDQLGFLAPLLRKIAPIRFQELLDRTDSAACFATPVYFRPPPTWLYRDRVVLIGDAAHPMTPDLGQGACQAIEDAIVLADCLVPIRPIEDSLGDFTARRLKRVRRIVREARILGKLNSSRSRMSELARISMFKLTPPGYSERHLQDISGREAFEAQMS